MANEIDAIAAISFLNDVAVIKDLKNELPRYLEKAWWMNNAHQPTYQTGLLSSVLTQSSQFSHFLFFSFSSITFFFHRLLHPYYYRTVINRELKQITTAGATTATMTEKIWGEYVLVVC